MIRWLPMLLILLFLFMLPILGGAGMSLLLVGLSRRWWAGFFVVPVVAALVQLDSLHVDGFSKFKISVVSLTFVNLTCLYLAREPQTGYYPPELESVHWL